ncbi:MAG: class D beta-lactamase [Magnetococcales bacterium]|nr:class D beta-lactamase [Magnetococcales bacterium]
MRMILRNHLLISVFLCVIAMVLFGPLCQASVQHDPELVTIFRRAGVEGNFVLIDTNRQQTIVSDVTGSQRRFMPASTFKVLNALIAIEAGVVQEESEIFPWNGAPLPIKAWERDLTLKEAMAVSAVPVFQEIARRIGLERMRQQVSRVGYGNSEVGSMVDRFWLDGPLAISAIESAQFMARLARRELPFSPQALDRLRRILPMESFGPTRLYGKTGLAASGKPIIGWYVGWVEQQDKIAAFALNILMKSTEEAPLRKSLTAEALRHLGVLE